MQYIFFLLHGQGRRDFSCWGRGEGEGGDIISVVRGRGEIIDMLLLVG
jgi:hypothetical protein